MYNDLNTVSIMIQLNMFYDVQLYMNKNLIKIKDNNINIKKKKP